MCRENLREEPSVEKVGREVTEAAMAVATPPQAKARVVARQELAGFMIQPVEDRSLRPEGEGHRVRFTAMFSSFR